MHEILFFIVVFITNAIQAITGFAGTLLAMPASILLIGVNDAKVILNFIAFLTCLIIVIKNRQHVQWTVLRKILILMGIGMIIGLWIFQIVQVQPLLYVYGAMITVIAINKLRNAKEKELNSLTQDGILLAAGIIHGMFVSGGALLVVYAAYVFKDKNEFRASMAAVWVVLNTFLMISEISEHLFTPRLVIFMLAASLPALAGVFVGNRLHEKISGPLFMKLTYILLLASGILCFI